MAHTSHPVGDPHAPPVGLNHETSDIPLAGTTRAALFALAGIAVVFALMWGAWGVFLSQARQGDPGRPPMSAEDYGRRLPATPRLQSLPADDLASYRAQQNAKLAGLAWIDQTAGTVRIPIEAAMHLIVSRADAFADPQAKAPADHSWSFPGASMPAPAPTGAAPVAPATTPAAGHGDAHAPAAPPAPGSGH